MAAEYEVNIKINTKKVETDLNTIDTKIKNLGKSATSKEQGLERIVDKRARLMNRINEMEAKGLRVAKLRAQMGKATEQQSRRDLTNAEREYRILDKSIRLEQSKLKILRSQREGFAASPIRGIRSMMGSPAQIAASGRQRVSPIGGRIDIAGSPAQMEAIRKLEMAEMQADKNAHFAELKLIQRRQKVELDNIDKKLAADLRALKKFDKELEAADKARQRRLAGANAGRGQFGPAAPPMQGPRQMIASPIGGAVNIPGSPAFLANQRRSAQLAQQRKNGARRFQDIATGAGFPLLFGGGPLQAIAGGVGGALGGLGGSIAATAAISQLQAFGQTAAEIGQAVSSTSGALDLMQEKALFSTKAIERQAAALEEQGNVQELNALITQELADKIGNEGIRSLQALGNTTDETTRLWGELTTQLAALISGPLNGFLSIVNQILGRVTTGFRFDAFLRDLNPEQRAQAEARVQELTKRVGTGRSAAKSMQMTEQEAQAQVLKEMGGMRPLDPGLIPITAADTKRFTVKNTAADKAAREEQRLQGRLAKLDQERQKVIEISRFKDQIAAAEAAGDQQLVIRLEGEQRIAEIEARRKEDLIGVTDQREIEAINIGKATEKLAAHREVERELEELQRQRQEKFDDTIENLQFQLDIAQATSEAERERLRIEKEMKKLKEDGMSEEQVAQVGNLMKQISAENSPLNKFIKQSVESLNDLQTQAVQIAQGIGNAIGNSLVGGIQNLITGAATVKEVFADMLKSVADVLAKQAAQMIATYISIGIARLFAGIGGSYGTGAEKPLTSGIDFSSAFSSGGFGISNFANGGLVTGGSPMLVGERGPELFVPFVNGEITSSESLGAEMANAMAVPFVPGGNQGGTTSQLINRQENTQINRQENLRQLSVPFSRSSEASMVAAAEQQTAEAISNPSPLDVRFESQSINGVEYVTAEQHQAGMAQAAQRGRALTLAALQNSVKARRRVGL